MRSTKLLGSNFNNTNPNTNPILIRAIIDLVEREDTVTDSRICDIKIQVCLLLD